MGLAHRGRRGILCPGSVFIRRRDGAARILLRHYRRSLKDRYPETEGADVLAEKAGAHTMSSFTVASKERTATMKGFGCFA